MAQAAEVQQKYANRIRARLANPTIDVVSARDGILDCFVATYFGGLQQGITGYLGIDASEEQVSRVAQQLFRKKLKAVGGSFDAPTVAHLDRVKQQVDAELHFEELPAELRGLHDQVCTLMLAKAEGTLDHNGASSSVRDSSKSNPASEKRARPTPRPSADQGPREHVRTAILAQLAAMHAAVREGKSLSHAVTQLSALVAADEALRDG